MNLTKIPAKIKVFGDTVYRGMTGISLSNYLMKTHASTEYSHKRRKLIHGVGINDATYNVTAYLDGKRVLCPAYRSWSDMIARGYSKKLKTDHPTYIGVVVCDEWLSFMCFRSWWVSNHIDGWHLDKDLLKYNNKVYSPDTCVYVPQHINKLITDHRLARGEYKIGVSFCRKSKKYIARCWSQISGRREYLGFFATEEEAYEAWLKKKLDSVDFLKSDMDSINKSIYENVLKIIKRAQ